jgi:hypothetical protein
MGDNNGMTKKQRLSMSGISVPMEPGYSTVETEGRLSPDTKKIMAALLAEFLGTLFFVLVATGIQVRLLSSSLSVRPTLDLPVAAASRCKTPGCGVVIGGCSSLKKDANIDKQLCAILRPFVHCCFARSEYK